MIPARLLPAAAALAMLVSALPAACLTLPDWLSLTSRAEETPAPRPVVTEILADRDALARWVPGVVASRKQVAMAFQTLGRIEARHVELGDRVEQGDVLAELATEDLEANTRAARAALGAAEVQLSTARSTLDRTTALAARNVASDAQLEQAQRAAAAAEAEAAQAASELARAEDARNFAVMSAPFAGVVSAIFEAPGAVVDAGAPVLQLSAENRREAVIDLPEAALASLPKDAAFTVWQRSRPALQVPALLDRIDPLADAATRTRRLYLSLPADAPFRLGALVRARLGLPDAPMPSVPAEAIFRRDGQALVWRVLRRGSGPSATASVEAVAIDTGTELLGRVVVTGGLDRGDEIVIRGVNSLVEGQAVGRRVDP
ncbi:efflux RND transporter periplasmic adaptor subunit [Paracoccus spongiarum]|uniref:Efflux RND transporter periplasmic adaptor subunit n=1 Tax=Paracoccus spongiarum TaxID=3064387 RepID=A0ABT9JFF8_9RHOB|nr:efflux RND transporter periplasmic adaptor subunit [Paracoccus sp. 2205BS29-5]MDP5308545.1 efflux RND transporter periplasmic adaptor subunit [Paracoccus sp. 2205BS29-5]